MQEPDLFALMSCDPWFGALDEAERLAMLANSQVVRVNGGEYVFRKGDASNGFFGLAKGVLKASTLRPDGREGILAVLEPGNWFGEASVVDGWPRNHDVLAIGPAELLRIQQDEFDRLMLGHRFARAISKLQARRMRVVYAMLEDATLYSTRARIARRLQRLARGDITMAPTDRRVIALSQDCLAMMLGITRHTVALELKTMVLQGAISLGYGKIIIESMEKLEAVETDS